MPTATATPSTSKGAAPNAGAAAGMGARPFITGSRQIETHTYDQTVSLQATPVTLTNYELVTDGYVSGMYIYVQATTSANAATVAFAADAPFNILSNIQFSDVSNRPIIGPMSGWELKECIKYGGYSFSDDPQDSVTYSATTGAGGTGGSLSFVLHLPIEFVHRNAMGSLTNLSNAAVFRVEMTLNASGNVYTTAPTTLPSVRVRIQQIGWMESAGKDPFGNPASPAPPAVDSVQYWERQTYTVNPGAQNFRFTPFEGHVRGVLFLLRDGTGSRTVGETDFPDPLRVHYDATVPIDRLKDLWKREVEEVWGYKGAIDTAGGRESGVYPISYARDFGLKAGAEQSFGYLYVSSGTAIRFDGTIGGSGAHTLTVLWNYINPAGGNPLSLTGGK
jgi:hypothetical protein